MTYEKAYQQAKEQGNELVCALLEPYLKDDENKPFVTTMDKNEFLLYQEFKGLKNKQAAITNKLSEISGIKSDVHNSVDRTMDAVKDLFDFISVNNLDTFTDDRIDILIEEKVKIYANYCEEKASNVSLRNHIESINENFTKLLNERNDLNKKYESIPLWIRRIFIDKYQPEM